MSNLQQLKQEIWKDIEGFETLYQVSNLGKVKALYKEFIFPYGGIRKSPERILKPQYSSTYGIVILQKGGLKQCWKVHRLVAIHFIPNPNNYPQVNHIDCKKDNNAFYNLEWCDRTHNIRHAIANGLRREKYGFEHPNSKHIYDSETGILYPTLAETAKGLKVNFSTLSHYINGCKSKKGLSDRLASRFSKLVIHKL